MSHVSFEIIFVDLDHYQITPIPEIHWPQSLAGGLISALNRAGSGGNGVFSFVSIFSNFSYLLNLFNILVWDYGDLSIRAAYSDMLTKLLGSYLWFFDTTPQGDLSFNRDSLLKSISDFDYREVLSFLHDIILSE